MNSTLVLRSLATVVLSGVILWFGKTFLIPLAFALLTAMVLFPACKWLETKGFTKTTAILIPLLSVCMLFLGLLGILSYQLMVLSREWSLIQSQLEPLVTRIHDLIESALGWTQEEQSTWMKERISAFSTSAISMMQTIISSGLRGLVDLVIIPIYVALILSFRRKLVLFLTSTASDEMRHRLPEVISDTLQTFSRFIRGMGLVYLAVGALNTLGLWMLGVENALLYGMITAVMTIIPYFGIVISALLPITISWLHTGSLVQPVGIVVVFSIVQYVEAYLIYPWIVGRYVKINTLFALIAIFLGALFWGVPGMILFVPLFAVFRIFASHHPRLKAWSDVMEG